MPRPSHFNHFQSRPDGSWLAYNARTGAMAVMTAENYSLYNVICDKLAQNGRAQFTAPEQELLTQLEYGKFVFPDRFDELEFMKLQHYQARYDNRGLGLVIAPTMACNMACTYCFEGNKHGRMKPEVIEALLEFVGKLAKPLDHLSITWYGGEPLLAMDIIEDLTESFRDLAGENRFTYGAGIITNGSLLNSEMVDRLVAAGVDQAQVTVDGPSHIHDTKRPLKNGKSSFATILENITYAISKMGVALRVSVDKDMAREDVRLLLRELESAGLKNRVGIYFGYIEPATTACANIADNCYDKAGFARIEADFTALLLEEGYDVHKIPTPFPAICVAQQLTSHVIDPDGDMYRCFNYVGDKTKSVGNVREPLNVQNPEFVRLFKFVPFENEHCRSCDVLPLCMGGCPARRADFDPAHEEMCESWKYNLTSMLEIIAAAKQQRIQAAQKEAI
jgi:uncharacterized protein